MKKIELTDGTIVEMREPKVKDMRVVEASGETTEQGQEILLIGNLTGMTPGEVDELTLKDYGRLSDGLKDFLS